MHNIVVMTMDCNDLDRHAVHADRVMNLSPTAFSYWDRDLQCCYANDACIDWFGIEPEILVGSCLEDVLDILRLNPISRWSTRRCRASVARSCRPSTTASRSATASCSTSPTPAAILSAAC